MIGTLILAAVLVTVGYLVGARLSRGPVNSLARTLDERDRELAAARGDAQRLGALDPATQLASEQYLAAFLEREWRRGQRYLSPLSLVMIDVDHFKAYREKLGVPAADACLKAVADALRPAARRPGDLVARYGVAGFVVVMNGTGGEGAAVVAERLRTAVEALALPHPVSKTSSVVTISLGVASVVPSRETTWQEIELIARSESALRNAKDSGRNRVVQAREPAAAV